MRVRHSQFLNSKYQRAFVAGDVPYRANRHAIRDIDIRGDLHSGLRQLDTLLARLDVLDRTIKELHDGSTTIRKKLASLIRRA